MSDERTDIVLREAAPSSATIWGRLWSWLQDHFPLITSSAGDYTRAKVAQEEARARLIGAQAEVESAKAREIEAKTRATLSDLDRENAEWLANLRHEEQEQVIVQATANALSKLTQLLSDAQQRGIQISFEEMKKIQKQLTAGPEEGTKSE